MKKIIALLLAVVMVFALVACASTAKTEEKTDAPAPAETTNEETTAPAEETALRLRKKPLSPPATLSAPTSRSASF